MATSNFLPVRASAISRKVAMDRMLLRLFALVLLISSAVCSIAQTNTNTAAMVLKTPAEFEAYFRRNFWEAQSLYNKRLRPRDAYWKFARACFDAAEYSTNSTERALFAEQGIGACRSLLEMETNSAAGHYYLGMDLGQLAQTKGLGALKIVDEMEREFSAARTLDEKLDYAGPDRNLGLLYRDAPSFGSIGNRNKARRHLQRAVELAPDYPENYLNLIEAYIKWNDRNGSKRELKALEQLWPQAKTNLVGNAWAPSWFDWEKRRAAVKKKVDEPSKTIESPRQKDCLAPSREQPG
jgi:tetratricopeptide (TPR) repeat protein